MYATTYPDKETVRAYLRQRLRDRTPLPAMPEIRRHLGWQLVLRPTQCGQQSGGSEVMAGNERS